MTQKNQQNKRQAPRESTLEKGKLSQRFRDLLRLSIFTAIGACISLLVVNLVVFPLTLYAVRHKASYTALFTWAFLGFMLLLVAGSLANSIRHHVRNGYSPLQIAVHIFIRKPASALSSFAVFLVLSCALVAFLYLLLSKNYIFIHNTLGV